ncbi:MAG TPA: hypothetical protein VNX46_03335 [Candidatus Acidoferrum sp.]|nr:hypothetical protein [Candidatus Acidoferrum sp.]
MKLVNAGGCDVMRAEGKTPTPSSGLALVLANPTNSSKPLIEMMRIIFTVVCFGLDNKYSQIIQNPFRQCLRQCKMLPVSRFGRVNFAGLALRDWKNEL